MYFDTHAHYDSDAFDADRHQVLEGLGREVELGWSIRAVIWRHPALRWSWRSAIPSLYAAVGYHPENLEGVSLADLDAIRTLAAHPRVKPSARSDWTTTG